MKLYQKLITAFGVAILCLIAVWYAISRMVLLDGFVEAERYEVTRDVERVLGALQNELDSLDRVSADWSAWDDSYSFLVSGDPEYISSNLTDATYRNLQLSLIMYLDLAGQVVYARGYDLINGREAPVPAGMEEHLSSDGRLLYHPDPDSSVSGIVMLPQGPMLIAARPILTTEKEGPTRGTLIWGRFLDERKIKQLMDATRLSISLRRVNAPENEPDFQLAGSALAGGERIFTRALNQDQIAGYAWLSDIYGQPAQILRVEADRSVYQLGEAHTRYFLLAMVLVSTVLGLLTLLLFNRFVLARLTRLSESVSRIGRSGDLLLRITVEGKDELASLAAMFNQMLEKLELAQVDLQKREQFYRGVVEDQTEFICRFLPDGTLTFANEAYCRFFGKSREELIGLNLLSFLPQEEQERVHNYLRSFSPQRPVGVIEHRMVMESQEVRWQEWTYRAVFDGQGEILEFQSVGRDITEKKRLEDHLRHLSLHDSLTGLYNRGYFEEQLRILESGRHNPVGIIVADIDDLKAVNDTRGHRAGDALLLAAAQVLRKCFREGDIVARIGGDEFAVLLPNSS